VRIAFLCNAANAVFAEAVDKAQVRRLVKDIAEAIATQNEKLEAIGLGKEWAESFLQELRGVHFAAGRAQFAVLPSAELGPRDFQAIPEGVRT